MKYITAIIIAFMVFTIVYNIPKPKDVEGQKLEEIGEMPNIQIIRENEPRSIKEEIQYVFGDNWKLAYGVMMSESGGKGTATNYNKDKARSADFGFWQINDYWHDVSLECSRDIKCSTAFAYKLSKKGTDFSAWYGYRNKSYLTFMK